MSTVIEQPFASLFVLIAENFSLRSLRKLAELCPLRLNLFQRDLYFKLISAFRPTYTLPLPLAWEGHHCLIFHAFPITIER
jgi:hypothetical protein